MKRLVLTLLVAACTATLPGAVIVTLDHTTLSGAPGSTLTFTGTLQNTGLAEAFFTSATLNQAAELVGDTLPFFVNGATELTQQFSLLAGGLTGSFGLFDIFIPLGTLDGTYSLGHDLSLFGGSTSGDFDLLASAPFMVEVSSVPEPATWMLAGAALLTAGVWRRRHR